MFGKVFALVIMLCLLFSATALAAVPEKPEAVLEGGASVWSVLEDADRLEKNVDGGVMLCDMQGNELSPEVYYIILDDAQYLRVITTEGEYGKEGVISVDGAVLVPTEFDDVSIRGDWAFGAHYGEGTEEDHDVRVVMLGSDKTLYKVFETVSIYNLLTGECVDVIENRNFKELYAKNGYANVEKNDGTVTAYDPAGAVMDVHPSSAYDASHMKTASKSNMQVDYDGETGLYALADENGNLLTEHAYSFIYYELWFNDYGLDYCEVEDDEGHTGLLSRTGELVVPMAYDEIGRVGDDFETCGVFAAATGTNLTLIREGVCTDIPLDNDDRIEFIGTGILAHTGDDKWELIAPDGTVKALPENFDDYSYSVVDGVTYLVASEWIDGYQSTLMDDQGNELLKGKDISFSRDGHMLVAKEDSCEVYNLK